MLKSLYFKIVLILLIFIVAVMAAVGAILLNGVTAFYMDDFASQMNECFSADGFLARDIADAAKGQNSAYEIKEVLSSYRSILGIDEYRNYYVLNLDGEMLYGSDTELGSALIMTPNLLSAVSGSDNNLRGGGMDYADWAVRIPVAEGENRAEIRSRIDAWAAKMASLRSAPNLPTATVI